MSSQSGEVGVEQIVLMVLRNHCGIEGKIDLDSQLQTELGLDSVGMLTLQVEIENFYQLELDFEDVADAPQTVREIVRLVSTSIEGKEGLATSDVSDVEDAGE